MTDRLLASAILHRFRLIIGAGLAAAIVAGATGFWLERVRFGATDQSARAEVEQQLRARLRVGGTTLGFSTEQDDHLFWLMSDPDVNAVRLVLTLVEHGAWRDELPRLVTGALARQRRGAWSTTVANAWGTLAVQKFAAAFETAPVGGTTTAALAGANGSGTPGAQGAIAPSPQGSIDWSATPAGGVLTLPWPTSGGGDLALAQHGTGRPWATIQTRAAKVRACQVGIC